MMLPTVTTASEIGINLVQFGSSGKQPWLAPDTLTRNYPSCPGSWVSWGKGGSCMGTGERAATAPTCISAEELSGSFLLYWFTWVQDAWNMFFSVYVLFAVCVCVGKQVVTCQCPCSVR